MTKRKEKTNITLNTLTADELTITNFWGLILKRVGFLFIKLVGSRKSFYHLYNIVLGNYLMYFFASTSEVNNAVMIWKLFIGISLLNLIFMGFIQFDKVKTDLKIKAGV